MSRCHVKVLREENSFSSDFVSAPTAGRPPSVQSVHNSVARGDPARPECFAGARVGFDHRQHREVLVRAPFARRGTAGASQKALEEPMGD